MNIVQTPYFRRSYKKLHGKEKELVNNAIKKVIEKPSGGELEKGDLAGIRVYKFKLLDQQFLMAYEHKKDTLFCLRSGFTKIFIGVTFSVRSERYRT
ncbi:MAG TPA: type II toxin-antitoxin system RelE/ParE family toxin, partial [Thermodesulfobacteriota bacterium]|nr:type II toxin-antitoxin system RelE/ParE family toxin [Thermodesulfobacteriota bacterium]